MSNSEIESGNIQPADGTAVPPAAKATWILLSSLCCLFIIGAAIAIVIVLSLIPVYLSGKGVSSNTQGAAQFFLMYRSDLVNGSLLTITNLPQLRTSLINVLNLDRIDNINAQFIPAINNGSSRKKRVAESIQTDQLKLVSQNNLGDVLSLNISITYPANCFTNPCKQQFADAVFISINTTHTNFSLSIQFTNGFSTIVNLIFCSFDNDGGICRINNSTCPFGETCPQTTTQPSEVTNPPTETQTSGVTNPQTETQPGAVTLPQSTSQPGAVTLSQATTQPGGVTLPQTTTQPGGVTFPQTTTQPGNVTIPQTTTGTGGVTVPQNGTDIEGETCQDEDENCCSDVESRYSDDNEDENYCPEDVKHCDSDGDEDENCDLDDGEDENYCSEDVEQCHSDDDEDETCDLDDGEDGNYCSEDVEQCHSDDDEDETCDLADDEDETCDLADDEDETCDLDDGEGENYCSEDVEYCHSGDDEDVEVCPVDNDSEESCQDEYVGECPFDYDCGGSWQVENENCTVSIT